MTDGVAEVITALGTLLRMGFIPIYEMTASNQIDYLRVLAAAFAGSGSAGVIVVYFMDKIRQIPLLFCRNHIILCGINEITEDLARQFRERRMKTVVIGKGKGWDTDETIRKNATVMLSGKPDDPAMLSLARVKRARAVLALTDSDGRNAEIALSAIKVLGERREDPPVTCILQINNPGLWRIIREQALWAGKTRPVLFDFFNGPVFSARVLLSTYFIPRIPEWTGRPPLLVVVGLGRLGESIVTRATREWLEKTGGSVPLPVILVDIHSVAIRDRLLETYPLMANAADLTAVSIDVQSAEFQKAAFLDTCGSYPGVLAFICLNDDTAGLTAALTLSHHLSGQDARILVRMDHNPGLARLVGEKAGGSAGIIPFSSLSIASGCDLVLGGIREILARAIHDHYLETQARQAGKTGDPSLLPWDDLPGRLKASNRHQAEGIIAKLQAIGCDIVPMTDWRAARFSFSDREIESLAGMEHDRWMEDMRQQGFSFGPLKNEESKTHPSMVPYKDLSEAEREKDREAVRMIPYYLSLIDFQVYRPVHGALKPDTAVT